MLNQTYVQVDFDASINDYFDSEAIYCLILLSNFTYNEEAIDTECSNSRR